MRITAESLIVILLIGAVAGWLAGVLVKETGSNWSATAQLES